MSTAYYEKLVKEDLDLGVSTAVKRNPGGGSMTGTQIGLHTFAVTGVKTTSTWSPGALTAGAVATTTVTVAGAALGDFVLASYQSISTSSLLISANVSSANTVSVVLHNAGATTVTPASGTLAVLVFASA